ncbi:DUF4334 domain-containing protein [Lentzea sp. E54]|uniref:DUF4334 domain-containing protein n=1 Tax=Lentzea xerophila TaxID=3435883 RepID=UPI003DA4363D
MAHDHTDGLSRLAAGCTTEEAFALFDVLAPVRAAEMTGRWRGSELPTGHPLDGLLTASGWYGKQFDDPESVHPLLFSRGDDVFAAEPRRLRFGLTGRVPLRLVRAGRAALRFLEPVLRTSKPRARLRDLDYRGTTSAAMIYDHLPVIDVFRRVDEHTLLGVVDMRGLAGPYFFVLRRQG